MSFVRVWSRLTFSEEVFLTIDARAVFNIAFNMALLRFDSTELTFEQSIDITVTLTDARLCAQALY